MSAEQEAEDELVAEESAALQRQGWCGWCTRGAQRLHNVVSFRSLLCLIMCLLSSI